MRLLLLKVLIKKLIASVNKVIKNAKKTGQFDAWIEKASTYTQNKVSSEE